MRALLCVSCLLCLAAGPPAHFASAPSAPKAGRASLQGPAAENFPWSPDTGCHLNKHKPTGVYPDALAALEGLSLGHRITQGINYSTASSNVHGRDVTVNGRDYTGAVDISVLCLSEENVKELLGRLAAAGFAAWYRNPGKDGWKGPRHVHAVWAGCSLKPVLQKQIASWLDGRNGLALDKPYAFWTPDAEMKQKVRTLYDASNPTPH